MGCSPSLGPARGTCTHTALLSRSYRVVAYLAQYCYTKHCNNQRQMAVPAVYKVNRQDKTGIRAGHYSSHPPPKKKRYWVRSTHYPTTRAEGGVVHDGCLQLCTPHSAHRHSWIFQHCTVITCTLHDGKPTRLWRLADHHVDATEWSSKPVDGSNELGIVEIAVAILVAKMNHLLHFLLLQVYFEVEKNYV